MIDKETVQKIKDTADIVEVVGDYVNLVRRGANYMGLCPFHNERTPSFSVNRAKNFCYCFSCHKGGSPVNFIMEKEGVSYHEALLQLAKKYGIRVEERELTDEEREKQTKREGMLIANEWAMNYFEENLFDTDEGQNIGLQYLYHRGLTKDTIKSFRLGYCLDSFSSFTNAALKKGFNLDTLITLGLTGTAQNGNHYDKYRGRVIFPIMNTSGKVIAFGGRDLKGGPAKYINSPEAEIYKKSNELYGIFQARSAIAKEDRCYLVEGYLDVISMWQAGIKNVVASSGTALTDGQIALIHRFTQNVTLIYDGDEAGIKASLRGIDMLLAHQLDVKVLLLPDGDDPDSFAKKNTSEDFRKYIEENQTDIIRFKTKVLADDSAGDPQKRINAIRSIVTTLAHISDKVKRDVYVQECSKILNIKEESIIGEIARVRESILLIERSRRQHSDLDRFIRKEEKEVRSDNHSTQSQVSNKSNVIKEKENSLSPLEWNILEYCMKYGFVKLWETVDDDDNLYEISTLEYVKEEFELDEISFTTPEYSKIFDILYSMLPDFHKNLEKFKIDLNRQISEKLENEYAEIREHGMSMIEIERKEKKLKKEMEIFYKDQISEYAKSYSVKELTSHEDPKVRELANRAILQRHQLSNIFRRDGNIVQEEKDRLLPLILNSINLLKNGILDRELKQLLSDLRNIAPDNTEDLQKINGKISQILAARSKMAKDIGDRILSPGK